MIAQHDVAAVLDSCESRVVDLYLQIALEAPGVRLRIRGRLGLLLVLRAQPFDLLLLSLNKRLERFETFEDRFVTGLLRVTALLLTENPMVTASASMAPRMISGLLWFVDQVMKRCSHDLPARQSATQRERIPSTCRSRTFGCVGLKRIRLDG